MAKRLRAGTPEELAQAGHLIVTAEQGEICVVSDGEQYYALDNSCSHMGSQLHRGEIAKGYVICPWHRARFELTSGKSLDLYATDISSYAVVLDAGVIYVDPTPQDSRGSS